MLAVMDPAATAVGKSGCNGAPIAASTSNSDPPVQDFLSSGRTGRRNALPDILGQHAVITSSDLPTRLQALSTKDQSGLPLSTTTNEPQPGPSSSTS